MKAIILAGGKNTRLNDNENPMPKVLREVGGKPLLGYVLDSISYVDIDDIMIVVGFMHEKVMEKFDGHRFIKQGDDGYGTGYALKCGYDALKLDGYDGDVMVLQGDMPLIKSETSLKMIAEHKKNDSSCTLLSCHTELKLPFGRIVRNIENTVDKIVEEKNCTPEQKLIKELNVGMYIFDSVELGKALNKLKVNPVTNEYYLTEIIEIMRNDYKRVDAYITYDETELCGVNTFEDLEMVEKIISERNKS